MTADVAMVFMVRCCNGPMWFAGGECGNPRLGLPRTRLAAGLSLDDPELRERIHELDPGRIARSGHGPGYLTSQAAA